MKQNVIKIIIKNNKNGKYELTDKLPNDVRLKKISELFNTLMTNDSLIEKPVNMFHCNYERCIFKIESSMMTKKLINDLSSTVIMLVKIWYFFWYLFFFFQIMRLNSFSY